MAGSNTGAAKTAAGPAGIVLLEQTFPSDERLLIDEIAPLMATGKERFWYRISRWSIVRNSLFGMIERLTPGIWAMFLCRKRYIQDQARSSVTAGAATQVVNLGAGMDTLLARDQTFEDMPCFEVDLPGNIEAKREGLTRALGEVPRQLRLVPVDLAQESLDDRLAAAGYDPAQVTCFVWEAVTQYLDEDALRATFEFLSGAAPGSRVIFTYVRGEFLDGSEDFGLAWLRKRVLGKNPLWLFGMELDAVAGVVEPYGFRVLSNTGSAEIGARYVDGHSRSFALTDIEPIAVLEKTSA